MNQTLLLKIYSLLKLEYFYIIHVNYERETYLNSDMEGTWEEIFISLPFS